MIEIEIEQGTFAWEIRRSSSIGSSDAPVIMGDSLHRTPLQLWREKVNLVTPEDNFIFQRGHRLEIKARETYNIKYNANIVPKVFQSSEYKFAIASLDGWEDGAIWEGKYTGKDKFQWVYKYQKVLPEHKAQVQHQLMVTGANYADYMVYTIDDEEEIVDTVVIREMPDAEYIKILIEEEKKFYESLTMRIEPPPGSRDSVEVESETLKELLVSYRELDSKIKTLDAQRKAEKEKIVSMMIHPKMHFENITLGKSGKSTAIRFKKQK